MFLNHPHAVHARKEGDASCPAKQSSSHTDATPQGSNAAPTFKPEGAAAQLAAEWARDFWAKVVRGDLQVDDVEKAFKSAIEKATEETDAANCSLLAFAAVVKGHPDTPESLKAIASKELLDHSRGAYLINELRTLRAALGAAMIDFCHQIE